MKRIKVVVLAANLPVLTPFSLSELIEEMEKRDQNVYRVEPNREVMQILEKYDNNTMNGAMRKEVAEAARKQGQNDVDAMYAFWH